MKSCGPEGDGLYGMNVITQYRVVDTIKPTVIKALGMSLINGRNPYHEIRYKIHELFTKWN